MTEHFSYQGRMVAKDNFRAYIYGSDGSSKLVNSWQEFEDCISTGIWFDSIDNVREKEIKKKGKN